MVFSICLATMYLPDIKQKHDTANICVSTASIRLGIEAVLDSCGHGSEISGFMTREKILDFLKELLKM